VGLLAGPFVAAAALLALAGTFKVRRPAPTARALRTAGLGVLAPVARALGVAELAVGVGALVLDTRVVPALVAAFYLGFAAFVALGLARATPASDCGCFGQTESPPTAIHLVMNLGAAGVAAAVALGPGGGLATALLDQPLGGVPFLLLAATCVGLAYAALAVLPRAVEGTRR
jgi:hypothetical protein